MTPWLQDADVTLYHGDALSTLRELPAESVDCVVTSPPYWGLRDYGTGAWEGGDVECDHKGLPLRQSDKSTLGVYADGRSYYREGFDPAQQSKARTGGVPYRDTCGKCGATRIDQQLGLESTPEQYVERMVEVFREIRRVLAPHGTCWLNLGDSYVSNGFWKDAPASTTGAVGITRGARSMAQRGPGITRVEGLKTKDLVGIPWRTAFALQADGWYLRSDIIWSKPNPMPESVTDRPTKAHEYLFLLSKQPRYFFDAEAVRERITSEASIARNRSTPRVFSSQAAAEGLVSGANGAGRGFVVSEAQGRNIRSVWEIATQPYPEAHFATFPEELARRAIAAGCPEQVCRVCGKARERVVELGKFGPSDGRHYKPYSEPKHRGEPGRPHPSGWNKLAGGTGGMGRYERTHIGFTDCGHSDYRPGIILDPFMGSGTVAYVARKLGRHSIGIDLSSEYLALAAKRLAQQSLFALEREPAHLGALAAQEASHDG